MAKGKQKFGTTLEEQARTATRTRYAAAVEKVLRDRYVIPKGYPLANLCTANDIITKGRAAGRLAGEVAHVIALDKGWPERGD